MFTKRLTAAIIAATLAGGGLVTTAFAFDSPGASQPVLGHDDTREIVGVVYSPLSRKWSLNARDLDVNYMLYGSKAVG